MNTAHRIPSPDDIQFKLFIDMQPVTTTPQLQTAINSNRRFITGDPHAIFLGTARLQDYLQQSGQLAPLTIARLQATLK